jgi:hypothetical protein
MKRRSILLVTVALMMVAWMMALSGAALAQGGDVCVSNKGDTKVDRGDSTCSSDETSRAVAVNFTQSRRRGIRRTSPFGDSRKFA